jgi:hypothetical protein
MAMSLAFQLVPLGSHRKTICRPSGDHENVPLPPPDLEEVTTPVAHYLDTNVPTNQLDDSVVKRSSQIVRHLDESGADQGGDRLGDLGISIGIGIWTGHGGGSSFHPSGLTS